MSRITIDTYDPGDPRIKAASERINRLIRNAAMKRARRRHREIKVARSLSDFDFPTWRVTARPFDYEIDA